MNAYSLVISGSWWILVLIIAAAATFAIWSYRQTIPEISLRRKIIQISLRTIAMSLLIFALFEPVLTMVRAIVEKPQIAILLDNSISAGLADARVNRQKDFEQALTATDFKSIGEDRYFITQFDGEAREIVPFAFDSMKFDGKATDISLAIKHAARLADERNVQAALLITDGAYNTGSNPLHAVSELGKPVYIVGIGDSTEPRDIAVQSILANDVAYIDNPVPVSVNIKTSGYSDGEVKVNLYDNNEFVSEQTFRIASVGEEANLVFQYNPKKEGVRKITATVSSLEGEITAKNNQLSEFIKVMKNKRFVAVFAGAPSADVSFLINSLSSQKGIEIKKYIQKKDSEFFENPPTQSELKDAEVIIFVGFPITTSSQSSLDLVKNELERGKPIFFIASQQVDYNKLKVIQDYLPFVTISSRPAEFLALADLKADALSSPLLRVTGTEKDLDSWKELPPLYRTETFMKVKPESDVVAGVKVNNVPLKEPLIVTRSFQNSKSVALLGYGIYRWKLLGYAADVAKERNETPDLLDIFLNNAYRWLSVVSDNKYVRIKTSKKNYNSSETIEIFGQVYDKAYNPIDNATVSVKVSGGGQERDLILTSLGNGRYQGQIAGLMEGDYYFGGDAINESGKLGSDNGRFTVGEVALEYLNFRMNAQLLRALAEQTGGKFYTSQNAANFMIDLKNKATFKDKSVSSRSDISLWNLSWLLGTAIVAFAIEWFMRKRAGLV